MASFADKLRLPNLQKIKIKIYREILGIQKNEIFGKYYLESGIQYFKIIIKRNEKMKEIIDKIEKYKEL